MGQRVLVGLLLALMLVASLTVSAFASSTADIDVTVTPQMVAISVDLDEYDFGVQATSATPSSTTSYFTIDNTSNTQTDQTISVTSATWEGGDYDWTHSDTATPGDQIVGLKANKGGTWGVSDVIVKNATPNYIAENQAANTDYSLGLKMWVPTAFSALDTGTEKANVVRVSAAAG